jgi:fluoride exporter
MDWILIGLGAGAGSVLRFEIGRLMGRRTPAQHSSAKTLGTFAVNLTGAFLMGIVVAVSIDDLWWSLLADGFLGGFTTFSTFMVEGVLLVRGNQKMNAFIYFAATVALGIVFFLMGSIVAGWFYP